MNDWEKFADHYGLPMGILLVVAWLFVKKFLPAFMAQGKRMEELLQRQVEEGGRRYDEQSREFREALSEYIEKSARALDLNSNAINNISTALSLLTREVREERDTPPSSTRRSIK